MFLFGQKWMLTAAVIGQEGLWPPGERLGRRASKAGLFRFLSVCEAVHLCGPGQNPS